jgi:hypothetical protein
MNRHKVGNSRESGVGSRESGVGSRESGVGSRESGVKNFLSIKGMAIISDCQIFLKYFQLIIEVYELQVLLPTPDS